MTRTGEGKGGGGGIEIGAGLPHGVSIRRATDLTLPPWLQVDSAFRLMTVEKGAVGAQNSLTVRRLDFRYGYAVGANVESGSGGAIHSPNDVTIEASSFYSNSAQHDGGAVRAIGKLAVSDSAFSGNTAFFQGGALDYSAQPGLAAQSISGRASPSTRPSIMAERSASARMSSCPARSSRSRHWISRRRTSRTTTPRVVAVESPLGQACS